MSKRSHKGGGVGSNQFGSKGSPKDRASSSANTYGRKAAMAAATAANAAAVDEKPVIGREEHSVGVAHGDLRKFGQNSALGGIEWFYLAMQDGDATVAEAVETALQGAGNDSDLGSGQHGGVSSGLDRLHVEHDLNEPTDDEDMYGYNCAADGIELAAETYISCGDLDAACQAAAQRCSESETLGSNADEKARWRECLDQNIPGTDQVVKLDIDGAPNENGFYLRSITVIPTGGEPAGTTHSVETHYGHTEFTDDQLQEACGDERPGESYEVGNAGVTFTHYPSFESDHAGVETLRGAIAAAHHSAKDFNANLGVLNV